MEVKNTFKLLKGNSNFTNFGESELSKMSIDKGQVKLFFSLKLAESNIKHVGKNYIFRELEKSVQTKSNFVSIVNMENNLLPVVYNKPTNSIIINSHFFGVSEISNVDYRDLYACMVYGVCLQKIMSHKVKISIDTVYPISNFLMSIFVKVFGKKYGLLGIYSTKIPALKFLLNCYVLSSFVGITTSNKLYKYASIGASFDYYSYTDQLNNYNFSDIDQLIKSISDFGVMRGFSKLDLVHSIVKFLSINFLPGLEDLSRFIAIVITSDLAGTKIVPTHIKKYNKNEFNNLLKLTNYIFK